MKLINYSSILSDLFCLVCGESDEMSTKFGGWWGGYLGLLDSLLTVKHLPNFCKKN